MFGGEELRKEEWLGTLKFLVGHIQIGYLQRVGATRLRNAHSCLLNAKGSSSDRSEMGSLFHILE